ncbi:MAG: BatA domain-containing protein [Gemmatimonadota bacterium]
MSFLHPWALALAPLALLPILFHLRHREATRRVPFPALRYLTRARDAHARSLRAADLLLLAARIGLLLLMVGAAAGPLIGRGGPADHPPTDVALVVDNSASTGRLDGEAPLLRRLVARARLTLQAAGARDRFWVFPAVGRPLAAGAGASAAGAALDRLAGTDGRGELLRTISLAAAALPGAEGRAREVHLLSDLQASALQPTAVPAAGPSDSVAVLVYDPGPLAGDNAAVVSVELSAGRTWPFGLPQTAVAEARRYGVEAERAAEGDTIARLRWEVDGVTAGGVTVRWAAAAALRLPDLGPGLHAGRVEIEPHGLRADDSRYFALRVLSPPSVAHRGPPESFVGLGLATLRAGGRLGEGPPRVWILEGAGGTLADTEAGPAASLVFLPPEDPVELAPFNQALARFGTPWRVEADTLRGSVRLAPAGEVPGLEETAIHRRHLLIAPPPGPAADTILLRTEDGAPWLIRGRYGGRTCLLLASAIAPTATDLPARPAMIPFLETLILRWSLPRGGSAVQASAGRAAPLPSWVRFVRAPDGATRAVEGGAPFTPWRAGVYELFSRRPERAAAASGDGPGAAPPESQAPAGDSRGPADEPRGLLAANVPLPESELLALPRGRVQELFPGRTVLIAGPDPAEWGRAIYRRRRGFNATRWLLALAVGLAAAEAFLATPRRRRRSTGIGGGRQTTDVS